MLTPPPGFRDGHLRQVLRREWGVVAGKAAYLPVGFGSHHWSVAVEGDPRRWFATVDELEQKRQTESESSDEAFARLRAAFATARALADGGAEYVVAPVPTLGGEPVARAGLGLAATLHPFIAGETFDFGEFSSPAHARGVFELIVALHGTVRTPGTVPDTARVDDFVVPKRDRLELALVASGKWDEWNAGPFGAPALALVRAHASAIRELLGRYDALVAAVLAAARPSVVTHGEPHAGNTMRLGDRWLLIDWDTVLLAPPERDLWRLDPGDGSVAAAYEAATGRAVHRAALDLYRVRWELADLAVYVAEFHAPHAGDLNDEKSWQELQALLARMRLGLDA